MDGSRLGHVLVPESGVLSVRSLKALQRDAAMLRKEADEAKSLLNSKDALISELQESLALLKAGIKEEANQVLTLTLTLTLKAGIMEEANEVLRMKFEVEERIEDALSRADASDAKCISLQRASDLAVNEAKAKKVPAETLLTLAFTLTLTPIGGGSGGRSVRL